MFYQSTYSFIAVFLFYVILSISKCTLTENYREEPSFLCKNIFIKNQFSQITAISLFTASKKKLKVIFCVCVRVCGQIWLLKVEQSIQKFMSKKFTFLFSSLWIHKVVVLRVIPVERFFNMCSHNHCVLLCTFFSL